MDDEESFKDGVVAVWICISQVSMEFSEIDMLKAVLVGQNLCPSCQGTSQDERLLKIG